MGGPAVSVFLTRTSPIPPLAAHLVNTAVHCCNTALPRGWLQQRAAADVLRKAAALQGEGGQNQRRPFCAAGSASAGIQRFPCSSLRKQQPRAAQACADAGWLWLYSPQVGGGLRAHGQGRAEQGRIGQGRAGPRALAGRAAHVEGKGRDQQVGYDGQGARHSRAEHGHDTRSCKGVPGTEGGGAGVLASCSPSLHAPLTPHLAGTAEIALACHAGWPTRMLPTYHARGASSCAWGLSTSVPARLTKQQLPGVPQHVWRRRPLQAGQGAHGARASLLTDCMLPLGAGRKAAVRPGGRPSWQAAQQTPPPPNSPTPSLPGRRTVGREGCARPMP